MRLANSTLDKILEEIVVQDVGNVFQQSCVDGGVGVHLIEMVGRAGDLACEPNRGAALLLQHGFDSFPDMYVFGLRHKKCVEFQFLARVQRVSTPYSFLQVIPRRTWYGIS